MSPARSQLEACPTPRPGAVPTGSEKLEHVRCPRCRTERGPVSAFIADQIRWHGCADCWNLRAEELAAAAPPRPCRLPAPLGLVPSPEPTAPIPTSIEVEKQEVSAGSRPPVEGPVDEPADYSGIMHVSRDDSDEEGPPEAEPDNLTRGVNPAIPDPPQDLETPPAAGEGPATTPDDPEEGTVDQKTEDRVLELLVEHVSIPNIMKATGTTKPDVTAVRDQARDEGVKCACDNQLGHRGTCKGSAKAKPEPRKAPASSNGAAAAGTDGVHRSFIEVLDTRAAVIRAEIEERQAWLEQIGLTRESVEDAAAALGEG